MPSFGGFLDFFNFKKKPNMPSEFKPTLTVQHRYEKLDVLEKCLKGFGYKETQWQINDKNRPGIQIQLPEGKKLTAEQIKTVHEAYVAEHKKRMQNNDDEE